MPDVNLLRDTEQPADQTPKPPRPQTPGPLTDPAADRGVGRFFRSVLGRGQKSPANPLPPRVGDPSKMGLNRSRPDERIIKEVRSSARTMVPLPEDETDYNVNLLSEDLISQTKPREQAIKLGLVAAGAVILVGLMYLGIELLQRSISTDINAAKAELASTGASIAELQDEKDAIETTTRKISVIRDRISQHIVWSRFFTTIEKYTLPDVTYGPTFSGSIEGSFTFTASAGSFESIAKQYLIFEQAVEERDFISRFTITGASRSEGDQGESFSFVVAFTIVPELLLNTAGGPTGPTTAEQDLQAVIDCQLRSNRSDLQYFPLSRQAALTALLDGASQTDCGQVSDTRLTSLIAEYRTDTDQDGVNDLYERVVGLNPTQIDSDGDGETDILELGPVPDDETVPLNTNTAS